MKKLFIVGLFMVGGLFILTGCGENLAEKAVEKSIEAETGGQVDIQDDGFTLTDDEGNTYTTSTSTELPADYPEAAEYYPGELTGASTLTTPDGKMFTLVIQTDDSLTDVLNFYNNFLADKEWQDTASLQSAGNVIVGGTLDNISFSAVAAPADDGSSQNVVNHTVTVRE